MTQHLPSFQAQRVPPLFSRPSRQMARQITQLGARPDWPMDADGLVSWVQRHAHFEVPGQPLTLEPHVRAVATWVRRSGGCDSLIAAALLQGLQAVPEPAGVPVTWLRTLFPDSVIGPLRLLPAATAWRRLRDPAHLLSDGFLGRPHAVRAVRLAECVEAARGQPVDLPMLPWSALLPVLRRCALD